MSGENRIVRICLSEMIPGRLWQSACHVRWTLVEDAGIDSIINVGHEEQPWLEGWKAHVQSQFVPMTQCRQPIYLHIPLFDADACLDPVACDVAIQAGIRILSDPERRVLVHCEAGAYRSVHVTAGIIATIEDLSGHEAFVETDRRAGRQRDPRKSLGMAGWHEHVETFGRSP